MRELYEKVAHLANAKFKEEPPVELKEHMLVCTVDLGNNMLTYRISKVNKDGTVDVILPNVEPQTIPVTSLYWPNIAQDILLGML